MTERITKFFQDIFSFDEGNPLLFTQLQFWIFFAIIFAGFAIIMNRSRSRLNGNHSTLNSISPRKRLLRNAYLFLVSMFFYFKTSGLFVLMLLFVICSDFFIAQGIYAARQKSKNGLATILLCLSVIIDLGILTYFKYSYFIVSVINNVFGTQFEVVNIMAEFGNTLFGQAVWSVDVILLPVGISFFTFQLISYSVDVYRGQIQPVRNLFDFGFYVSFFPQLVAGPIVKASDFIPQLYKPYRLSRKHFGMAVFWILNGFIKKIVLADYIALNFNDRVFENPMLFSGFENVMALFSYSLQVYADFSGYTDIAIGLSMLFGFYLPLNFDSPYKADSAQNFWRRWHISLSRWLKTYLYIPLGGNRSAKIGTAFWIVVITLSIIILSSSVVAGLSFLLGYVLLLMFVRWGKIDKKKVYGNLNSFITMLLGGLWHGASFNLVIWGGLNGLGIVVYKLWSGMNVSMRVVLGCLSSVVVLVLNFVFEQPFLVILLAFVLFITLAQFVICLYKMFERPSNVGWLSGMFRKLGGGYSVLLTFVFITFTRLFFRSGSNLDPEIANETAWNLANDMMAQIARAWDVNIWEVCKVYANVFILFALGMLIHWLPSRLKRRYRIMFARLPLVVMGLVVVAVVLVVYQFMSAEMQPFIYFQF